MFLQASVEFKKKKMENPTNDLMGKNDGFLCPMFPVDFLGIHVGSIGGSADEGEWKTAQVLVGVRRLTEKIVPVLYQHSISDIAVGK